MHLSLLYLSLSQLLSVFYSLGLLYLSSTPSTDLPRNKKINITSFLSFNVTIQFLLTTLFLYHSVAYLFSIISIVLGTF